jgi:membrane protein DedA with SNARE-associated domain
MGIVEMDFRLYSLFTLLGSALWCSVLAWVGVAAGNDKQLVQGKLGHILPLVVGLDCRPLPVLIISWCIVSSANRRHEN